MKELNVKVGDKVRFVREWIGTSPCYDIELGTVARVKMVYGDSLALEVPNRNFAFCTDLRGKAFGSGNEFIYIEPMLTYKIGAKIVFNKPLACFNKGDVAEITGIKPTCYSWDDLSVQLVADSSLTAIVDSENEAFTLYKEDAVVKTEQRDLRLGDYVRFRYGWGLIKAGTIGVVDEERPDGVMVTADNDKMFVGKQGYRNAIQYVELADANTEEATPTEPTYLTFPETLHALADGKELAVAGANEYSAVGMIYYLKNNVLMVRGLECGQDMPSLCKIDNLEHMKLVLAPEPKPWYEDLEGKPRLCWVWDAGDTETGHSRTVTFVVGYDVDCVYGYFRDNQGNHWQHATPLTKEEIQTYLDNA